VLLSGVLGCVVLHPFVRHQNALFFATVQCNATSTGWYFIVLCCTVLYCTARHGTARHCTAQAAERGCCCCLSLDSLSATHLACSAGEVPGLFAPDDKDAIVADVREWVLASGGNPSKDGCYSAFIDRVRDNLHIVLTMSPVGEAFRARWARGTDSDSVLCHPVPVLVSCQGMCFRWHRHFYAFVCYTVHLICNV
jgi:hypothetical protein